MEKARLFFNYIFTFFKEFGVSEIFLFSKDILNVFKSDSKNMYNVTINLDFK